jgi:hypothetical protein
MPDLQFTIANSGIESANGLRWIQARSGKRSVTFNTFDFHDRATNSAMQSAS